MIWFCFILLLTHLTYQQDYLSVTADSTTVNTVTPYTFSFMILNDYTIPSGSKLVITFPSDYTSLVPSGSSTCSANSWPVSGASISCSFTGLVLTVSGGFPTAYVSNYDIL